MEDIITYDFEEKQVNIKGQDYSAIVPTEHSKVKALIYNEIDKTDHAAIMACDIQTCGFPLDYEIEFLVLYQRKKKWKTIYQGKPKDFEEQSKVKAKIKNPPDNTCPFELQEKTDKRRYFNICSMLLELETPKRKKQLLAQKRIADISKEKEKLTQEQKKLENILTNSA